MGQHGEQSILLLFFAPILKPLLYTFSCPKVALFLPIECGLLELRIDSSFFISRKEIDPDRLTAFYFFHFWMVFILFIVVFRF